MNSQQEFADLVGDPKTDRIRIIADKIEKHPFYFCQSTLGPAQANRKHIGSGISTGSSACVAGFTVQFLGTVDGYEGMKLEFLQRGVDFFRDDAYGSVYGQCDVERYASVLLGLPSEWAKAIYTTVWPRSWINESVELEPSPIINSTYWSGRNLYPKSNDAAFFLRRLADHLEDKTRVRSNS